MDRVDYVAVVTPPQCGARRPMRFREWFWWKVLGPVRGFDPAVELRCHHYAGHGQYAASNPDQALHEDVNGNRWR